jgi:hypothetical protein
MDTERMTQDELAREAELLAGRMTGAAREKLLLQGWMWHDARWFTATAQEFGLQAANQLNTTAARETGRVEARRTLKLLDVPPPSDLQACVIAQEAIGRLLAPGLVDYDITTDGDSVRYDVRHCFAYENVTKAGIASEYRCGIFPRVAGWWDVFDVTYELTPKPGPCMMAAGRPCAYTIRFGRE